MSDLLSLADLSDLDVTNIKEVRFENVAAGLFMFECLSAGLISVGSDEKPAGSFKCEVKEVQGLLDDSINADKVRGKVHEERIFITDDDPETGIGRIRAFIADAGGNNVGKLGTILSGFVGVRFKGRISHRPDPKDKTRIYANIRFDGIAADSEQV